MASVLLIDGVLTTLAFDGPTLPALPMAFGIFQDFL